ncbi:MAG: YbaB/EbfC family nucleoid-associated protein [Anaerolineaceae bacterium]|nr:YbaB/EbfC family nucleoid-associated protein [Anaerolineaceae bacterium]
MFGDLAGMLKKVQQMQKQMQEAKQSLEDRQVEGRSGGGMVTVTTNGRGEILSLKISPEVVDPEKVELLEDLVRAAVRQTNEQSRKLIKDEIGKAVGGLGIPGIGRLLGDFGM